MVKKIIIALIFLVLFAGRSACGRVVHAAADDAPFRTLYVLAAPFNTVTDEINSSDLIQFWQSPSAVGSNASIIPSIILLSETGKPQFANFGEAGNPNITDVSEPEKAIKQALDSRHWIILPFDLLDPRLKVITIDGMNPLEKQFNPDLWPLITNEGKNAPPDFDWSTAPIANRDPDKLTTLVLTGVTAMVRGTASYMDALGPEYPATNIYQVLQNADILHVNNEVPFAPVCQQTEEDYQRLRFCSKKRAMDLLTFIGTDIVELDGDHFQDFGDEAIFFTLDLYREAGIQYYGGGKNKAEAIEPLLLEHNGNRFAFIGCNAKEIGYTSASDTRPGAVHCDFPAVRAQIRRLKSQGILPIVTMQHIEYYHEFPNEEMRNDFLSLAKSGAVIVSGSQSHIPMAFEITGDAFLHYGLGNLFFDQAFFLPETSEATIDQHVFYDGRHLSTQILTIKFTNLALNRFMTPEERAAMLSRIFAESLIDER